jgi:hypothetical protein
MAIHWGEVKQRAKEYAFHCGVAYLSFVVPIAVFLAFNSAADTLSRDQEKYGALWLQYNRLEPEQRERQFPAVRPGSVAAHDM